MKKKYRTLTEEINRMKSLFTEERLYGNLVDKPLLTEANITRYFGDAFMKASKGLIRTLPNFNTLVSSLAKPINNFSDFSKHFDEFPVIWKQLVGDSNFQSISGNLKFLSHMENTGNMGTKADQFNIYNIIQGDSVGRSFIDFFPETGGLRSMVELKFYDEAGVLPTTRRIGKGDDVEVITFDKNINTKPIIFDKNKKGEVTITKDGETKILTDKEGKPIKVDDGSKSYGGNIQDITYVDIPSKKTNNPDEFKKEVEVSTEKSFQKGNITFTIHGNNNNIHFGDKTAREVVQAAVEKTIKSWTKKFPHLKLGYDKIKQVLRYVGVNQPVLANLLNPYAIGGVAKTGFLPKSRGATILMRLSIHGLLYYFFIHKMCQSSSAEKGGQDPEPFPDNWMNLWIDGKFVFMPCFYPLWGFRLITDWSWITARFNLTQRNFCIKYDTDIDGVATKSEDCDGFFQKLNNALKLVDAEKHKNKKWCEEYKDKDADEVFESQYDEALTKMSEDDKDSIIEGMKTVSDFVDMLGIDVDTSIDVFKSNEAIWEEFGNRLNANKLACTPAAGEGVNTGETTLYIPEEDVEGNEVNPDDVNPDDFNIPDKERLITCTLPTGEIKQLTAKECSAAGGKVGVIRM